MSIEAADTGMWAQLFFGISSLRAAEGPKAAFLGWASVVFAMWELSLGLVLGACSAGGVFLVGGAFIGRAPGVLRADFK